MTNSLKTIALTILIPLNCFSQKDSLSTKKTYEFTPRFSIGIQDAPYIEFGISRLETLGGMEFASNCFYSAIECNKRQHHSQPELFYGLKVGYETNATLGMIAIETKFISDFNKSRLILTPKIGFSIGGILNLLYGYNIGKDLIGFEGIGKHQFSLTYNMKRKTKK